MKPNDTHLFMTLTLEGGVQLLGNTFTAFLAQTCLPKPRSLNLEKVNSDLYLVLDSLEEVAY